MRNLWTTTRSGRVMLLACGLLLGAAERLSAQSITIAWDPNTESDVAGYTVHVGVAPNAPTQTFDVPAASNPTFTYNGAVPGQRYYFSVCAYNSSNLAGPRTGEISWKLNVGPTLAQPANAIGAVGSPAALQLAAVDDGDPLTFTAVGLPAGLSINSSTGLITGTPTADGASTVVATVSDGALSSSRTFTWTIGPRLVVTSLTSALASPQIAGTAITLTSAALGGLAPYEYKYLATVGGNTTVVRAWSSSASFTWTPALPGTYSLTVWARSAGVTADVAEGSMTTSFVVNPPPMSVTSLTSNPPSPQMITTNITLTTAATGGVAPYEYKYLVTLGSTTTTLRGWSTSASHTWIPTQANSYIVTVWVRSAGQTADVAEATRTLNFSVTPPPADLLVNDTFPGSTSLAAHPPDINIPGASWAVTGSTPAPTVSAGLARISAGSGHLQATLATGVSDFIMRVDYRVGSGPQLGALAFRLTDAGNHLMLMFYGNALQLYRKQAGTYTLLASQPVAPVAPGSTHRLEARAIGSNVEGWWDGVRVVQISTSFQQTATRHGLDWNSAYDATTTYDNFELRTPAPPAPPATPTSPSPGNGSIGVNTSATLTWAATGATSYDVRFGTDSAPPAAASNLTSASYTPAGLSASTTYYWQIVARSAGGTTAGPVWSFTTSAPPPPPGSPASPSPVDGALSVPTRPTLTWAASGATSYDVRFGTSNPPPSAATNLTSASYSPATLSASTTYYWQVVARNAGGTTAGPVWVLTTAAIAPDLLVSDTFAGSSSLPSHAPDINMTSSSWVVTGNPPTPTVSGGVARITSGAGHVQATIASGISDVVMGVDYRVGNGPQLGALAFRLADANNHLMLMFYGNALQFYYKQNGAYTLLASRPVGSVAAGSTHRLEVRAVGANLEGWWDGARVVQASTSYLQTATRHGLDWNSAYDTTTTYDNFELRTPAPPSAPGAPTNANPANSTVGIPTSTSLTWSASGATSYDVRFGTSNPPAAAASNLTSSSYIPPALNASTTYYWQIVARNSAGTTTGPVWSFTTAAPPPPPPPPQPPGVPASPSPADAASGVSSTPSLLWAATGATSYDVRFGTANPPAAAASNLTSASYTPGGLAPNTTYYWQVVARNAAGATAGPTWSFTTASVPADLLVSDSFAGSSSLTSHTPDVNMTGAGWVVTGNPPTPSVSGGVARIGSGGGHLQATIASGVSDFVMGVDYRVGNGPRLGALAFRLADANNHLLLMFYGNAVQFYYRQNGVYALLASQSVAPVATGSTHRLEVRANGSSLEGWWDGVRVVQASTSYLQNATRHGLDWNSAYDATTTYDNFELRIPGPPSAPASPTAPSPANGAASVLTTTPLAWSASGATSYDVRFGTSNPPADVATSVTTASYTPGALTTNTTYYWQIVARNTGGTTAGPVWSFTTAATSTDVLIADTFTGADGTLLTSHPLDLNGTAAAWAITGATPIPRLSSGRAGVAAGTGHMQATLNAGVSDFRMAVDYRAGSGPQLAAMPFRLQDANNHLLLMAYGSQLQFYYKQNGVYALMASRPLAPIVPGSTHRMEVRANGSRLEGWWDGVLVVQASTVFLQSATRHGLGWNSAYDPTTTYDNFELRVP